MCAKKKNTFLPSRHTTRDDKKKVEDVTLLIFTYKMEHIYMSIGFKNVVRVCDGHIRVVKGAKIKSEVKRYQTNWKI